MTGSSDDLADLCAAEKDAFSLCQVVLMLDEARANKDEAAIKAALAINMELWVGIRAFASSPSNGLVDVVRGNLITLSQYVSGKTVKQMQGLDDSVLDTLVNINLQISEGLLEGVNKAAKLAS